MGQLAIVAVREDLNRADAQRLRAHLEAVADAHPGTETHAWPYTRARAARGGIRVEVTVSGQCDRGGADRLHAHLDALLSVDVCELRVDLTGLRGGAPWVASTLGSVRSRLSGRNGTLTVVGGRRLLDHPPTPPAPAPVPGRARVGARPGHRVTRGRPETADQP